MKLFEFEINLRNLSYAIDRSKNKGDEMAKAGNRSLDEKTNIKILELQYLEINNLKLLRMAFYGSLVEI